MKEWCFDHPWMTFFLILFAFECIHCVAREIFNRK